MHTVLSNPELLTSIFIYLPLQDLLLLQRVSKAWQDVIRTAPSLRRLCFNPRAPLGRITHFPSRNSATERNASQDQTGSGSGDVDNVNGYYSSQLDRHLQSPAQLRINTLFLTHLTWSPHLPPHSARLHRAILAGRAGYDDPLDIRYKHASWRNQLLTWPPVKGVLVVDNTAELSLDHPPPKLWLTTEREGIVPVYVEPEPDFEDEEDVGWKNNNAPIKVWVGDLSWWEEEREYKELMVGDLLWGLRVWFERVSEALGGVYESGGDSWLNVQEDDGVELGFNGVPVVELWFSPKAFGGWPGWGKAGASGNPAAGDVKD